MKICFPIESDQGMESNISAHFGSAPAFLVVDTENGQTTTTTQAGKRRAHGQCSPLKELAPLSVEAVAVTGIGGGALNKLVKAGMKVYRANAGTVAGNIASLAEESLPELTADQACGGHGKGHGHGHKHH